MSEVTDYYSKVNVLKVGLIEMNSVLEKLLKTMGSKAFPEQYEKLLEARDLIASVKFPKYEDYHHG